MEGNYNYNKCLILISFQVEVYEDRDNARKDEIAALGGQTATGTNVFSAFYDRLKEVIYFFINFD
jgi:hypothetical protein